MTGLADVTAGPLAASVERWCLDLGLAPRPRGVCYSENPRQWCRWNPTCRSCLGQRRS